MSFMKRLREFFKGKDLPTDQFYWVLAGRSKIWHDGLGHPHRRGGLPAVEWANGSKEWWVNGKRHREPPFGK